MRIAWQSRWFETEEEAKSFVTGIWNAAWRVSIRKVNKANKKYTHGYTVTWYWREGKPPKGWLLFRSSTLQFKGLHPIDLKDSVT